MKVLGRNLNRVKGAEQSLGAKDVLTTGIAAIASRRSHRPKGLSKTFVLKGFGDSFFAKKAGRGFYAPNKYHNWTREDEERHLHRIQQIR